jgi:hypothetical protein
MGQSLVSLFNHVAVPDQNHERHDVQPKAGMRSSNVDELARMAGARTWLARAVRS